MYYQDEECIEQENVCTEQENVCIEQEKECIEIFSAASSFNKS